MSALDDALAKIREHEGGLSDDPADPGGITNYGISLRFLRSLGVALGDVDGDGDVDADDVRNITADDAAKIFTMAFWERYGYDELPDQIAVKVFDLCVNMGPKQVHLLLQRALRACGVRVVEDGILGPQTLGAVSNVDERGETNTLCVALRSEAAGFYRVLVAKRPELSVFSAGWIRRAYA